MNGVSYQNGLFKYSSITSEASYNDRNILVKLSFAFFSIFVSFPIFKVKWEGFFCRKEVKTQIWNS